MVHHNKESTNSEVHAHRDANHKAQLKANFKKRMKTVGIWAVCIAVLIILGYMFWGVSNSSPSTNGLPILLVNQVGSTDHWTGNNASKVLIVEYSDFQCPACAAYHPLVKKAIDEKGSQFEFVYRDFPLKLVHANAVVSSRAAEAAALQGQFWPMHDLLFERQKEWETASSLEDVFATYASQLGMNATQFRKDYNSAGVAAKVENDYLSGMRYNIQQTPTFFLNGQPFTFQSYDELAAAIDRYSK